MIRMALGLFAVQRGLAAAVTAGGDASRSPRISTTTAAPAAPSPRRPHRLDRLRRLSRLRLRRLRRLRRCLRRPRPRHPHQPASAAPYAPASRGLSAPPARARRPVSSAEEELALSPRPYHTISCHTMPVCVSATVHTPVRRGRWLHGSGSTDPGLTQAPGFHMYGDSDL